MKTETMTDEEMGRAAATLDGWVWAPRMRDNFGTTWGDVVMHDGARWRVLCCPAILDNAYTDGSLPDINDPATAGCLSQLGYDAGWLVLVRRIPRVDAPPFYAVHYIDQAGAMQAITPETSPGRGVAAAAIARGSWL